MSYTIILGLAAVANSFALAPRPALAQLTPFCQFTGAPGECLPYDHYGDAVGEDLRVTFLFAPDGRVLVDPPAAAPPPRAAKLNTIRDVLGALRVCFIRAALPGARQGVSATIRFAFTRTGALLGTPRLTYVSPGTGANLRQGIADAMDRALGACAPLPFTDGLGGAIAGRPLSVRIVIPAKPSARSRT